MTILWHIPNKGFSCQSNTCVFLTKSFHEIFRLSKNVIIFQSKATTEKRKTILTSNYPLTYYKQQLIFAEKDTCVSHKSISWNSYNYIRTCLSFKVKNLQRKATQFSLLTILWHIPNNSLCLQRKTRAFLTKAFHEILTLSNECDYLSK